MSKTLVAVAILAAALVGCAHGDGGKASSSGPRQTAASYYPLAVGNRWVYEARLLGETREQTIEIVSEKNGYFQDSAGGELTADAFGVRDPKRYLLRDPLEPGNGWTSIVSVSSAERYAITAVGVSCESPAGKFENCIQVEGRNRINPRATFVKRDTYAPGVGLVRFTTAILDGEEGDPPGGVRAEVVLAEGIEVREIGIALLGLGNVGLGTYRILQQHSNEIAQRLGAQVRVRHVLVQDAAKARGAGRPRGHHRLREDPRRPRGEGDRRARRRGRPGARLPAPGDRERPPRGHREQGAAHRPRRGALLGRPRARASTCTSRARSAEAFRSSARSARRSPRIGSRRSTGSSTAPRTSSSRR